MKLQCHDCGDEFDTKTKPPFSNYKTMLPHERYHNFCSIQCQANGEKKAELKRPKLVKVNGHDPFALVNYKAERMF